MSHTPTPMEPRRRFPSWLAVAAVLCGFVLFCSACLTPLRLEGLPCPEDGNCRAEDLTCTDGICTLRTQNLCHTCDCDKLKVTSLLPDKPATHVAYSPFSPQIALKLAGTPGDIALFQWSKESEKYEAHKTLGPLPEGELRSMLWLPDSARLFTLHVGQATTLGLWDTKEGTRIPKDIDSNELGKGPNVCASVGRLLGKPVVALCNEAVLSPCLVEDAQFTCLSQEGLYPPETPPLRAPYYLSALRPIAPVTLATYGTDNALRMWKFNEEKGSFGPMKKLLLPGLKGPHAARGKGLVMDPTGRYLASFAQDAPVRFWDALTGVFLATYISKGGPLPTGQPTSVVFDHRGYLVAISYRRHIDLLAVGTWKRVGTLVSPKHQNISSVAFDPHHPFRLLAAGNPNATWTCDAK